MRKFLGVNAALSKSSIKSAILDGKKQIQESQSTSDELTTENTDLKNRLVFLEREKLLGSLTSGLPVIKKKYVTRVLGNKSIEFINENFEYTLQLFEKSEEEKIHHARSETPQVGTQVDRPERELVKEQTEPTQTKGRTDPFGYMSELNKF